MRYPNTRYGNPVEFEYFTRGQTPAAIAKRLKRSERSVKDWLAARKKIPWWIPEILRLQAMEHEHIMWQMEIKPLRDKLGLVTQNATIHAFTQSKSKKPINIKIQSYASDATPSFRKPENGNCTSKRP